MGVIVTKQDNTQNWIPGMAQLTDSMNGVRGTMDMLFKQNMEKATTFDDPRAYKWLGVKQDMGGNDYNTIWGVDGQSSSGNPRINLDAGSGSVQENKSATPGVSNDTWAHNTKTFSRQAMLPQTSAKGLNIISKNDKGETIWSQLDPNFMENNYPDLYKSINKLDAGQQRFMTLQNQYEEIFGQQGTAAQVLQAEKEGKLYANKSDGDPALVEQSAQNAPNRMMKAAQTGKFDPSIYPEQAQNGIDTARTFIPGYDGLMQQAKVVNSTPAQIVQQPTQQRQMTSADYAAAFRAKQGQYSKSQKTAAINQAFSNGLIDQQTAAELQQEVNSNVRDNFKVNSNPIQNTTTDNQIREAQARANANTASQIAIMQAAQQMRGNSGGGQVVKGAAVEKGVDPAQQARLDMQAQKMDSATALKLAEFEEKLYNKKVKPDPRMVSVYNQLAQSLGRDNFFISDGKTAYPVNVNTPEGQLKRLVYNELGEPAFKNGQIKPAIAAQYADRILMQQAPVQAPVNVQKQTSSLLGQAQKELEAK